MRVPVIVAVLVVDCGDKACDATSQFFGKCPRQSLALVAGSLNRQGDNEPLTDASFAFLCGILGLLCRSSIRRTKQALSHHLASRAWPCDIAKVCGGLPDLRRATLGDALLRKCLYRMSERKQCHGVHRLEWRG